MIGLIQSGYVAQEVDKSVLVQSFNPDKDQEKSGFLQQTSCFLRAKIIQDKIQNYAFTITNPRVYSLILGKIYNLIIFSCD